MTMRSIIDIEVNTEKFKAFQAQFNKYQEALKKQGGHWDATGTAVKRTNAQFQKLADLAQTVNDDIAGAESNQDKLRKTTDKTDLSMKKLARTTYGVTKNILGATTALLKWSGVATAIGGLLGAGGLFGIDRLAASVAGKGRGASGLGVSIGQNQAFNLDFGRYVDTQNLLGNVVEAASSYEGRGDLAKLGVTNYNQNPADLAIEVMQRLRDKWRSTPADQRTSEYFNAFGANRFMSMKEMRRLGNAQDFSGQVSQYQRDQRALNIGGATATDYQNTKDMFSRAGLGIEKEFADTLARLNPALRKLSVAVEQATSTFLHSDAVRQAVDGLAKGIKTFADYLNSPEFSADLSDLMDSLGEVAGAIKKTAHFLVGNDSPGAQAQKAARLEQRFGLPSGSLSKIVNAGWGYGSWQSLNMGQRLDYKSYENRTAANLSRLAAYATHGGNPSAIRDFVKNMILGPERIEQLKRSYTPGKWESGMTAQERASVSRMTTELTVFNTTGGNAAVSVSGMVAQ